MIKLAIHVRNSLHYAYIAWEKFCCRRLNAHWPTVKYHTDAHVREHGGGHFAGYFCKLCDKKLDGIGDHLYTRTFSKHCYLWRGKP